MNTPPDDEDAPRLQDTTERSALPLPLPSDAPAGEAAPEAEDKSAAVEEPPAVDEPPPAVDEPPAQAAEPAPADKSASVEEPPGSPNGAPSFEESPFPPPFGPEADAGPRPEVLIGAAFAGGLLLALIFRRLGR
ncbi:MAG: hypothetical protein QOE65_1456 [Solirubrobacteraceae bacterium]|jgi:hypothetical protein|nr:hypothetical protein [Solirubrobacteraceae bacterium]